MRDPLLHIDGIHPRPGPVLVCREIQERSPVEHHRVGNPCILRRDAFGPRAERLNSPDVPVIRRNALHEIDIGVVGGPYGKVAVGPGRSNVDPAVLAAARLAQEQWISRRSRVIDEAPTITGPRELRHAREVLLQRTASRGHGQHVHVVRLDPSARRVQTATSVASGEKPRDRMAGLASSAALPGVKLR